MKLVKLNRFIPSRTTKSDPAIVRCDRSDILPIGISQVKLIPKVRRKIDQNRKKGAQILISRPKRLSIVVPYRNRKKQLEDFLSYMESYFCSHNISGHIIISEQSDNLPFNRGALKNAGARLALESSDAICFHDVDLLPENADYFFSSQPMVMIGKTIDQKGNTTNQYDFTHFFGGVVIFESDKVNIINGYSNNFWGWGMEDDNLLFRCLFSGLHPIRNNSNIYCELPHHSSLTLNRNGQIASERVKKENMKYLRKNRLYQSKIKRQLIPHSEEGISTLCAKSSVAHKSVLYTRIKTDLNPLISE